MNLEIMPVGRPKEPAKKPAREVGPGDPRRMAQDFLLRATAGDVDTQQSLDRLIEMLRDNYLKYARTKPREIPEAGAISNNIRVKAIELARQPGADYESVYSQLTDLVTEYIEKKYRPRSERELS